MSAAPLAVRAYRALLLLLPRAVRAQDGEEMERTFAAMWAEARVRGGRLKCATTSLLGLLAVAATEWMELISGFGRAPVTGTLSATPDRSGGALASWDASQRAFRHAARSLLRAPSFTLSSVLLMGLGVGAVTTIFTVIDHVLLRPLPYPHADRLVEVTEGAWSGPILRDLESLESVEEWVAIASTWVTLTGETSPQRLREGRVTEPFFEFFGAGVAVGRLLAPDDFAAADAVVLSYDLWRESFGEDPSVVGRTILLDGHASPVVGVLARDFVTPEALLYDAPPDLWRPVDRSTPAYSDRSYQDWSVAGRLAPGATLAEASAEADALATRLAAENPDLYRNRDGTPRAMPIVDLRESTVGEARQGLGLLLGAVLLLLLVACVNVAHLFMARGLGRHREISLKRALGAGNRSIAGQLLTESLLVGAGGAALGLGLAVVGLGAFLALAPGVLPRTEQLTIDYRALVFAVGLAGLTSALFGLLPALRSSGRDPGQVLGTSGRGTTSGVGTRRVQSGLVVLEVALSLVLVAGAGLLLRSYAAQRGVDLGFRVEDVWTIPLVTESTGNVASDRQRIDAVRDALAAVPGVHMATYARELPLQFTGGNTCCWMTYMTTPGTETRVLGKVHSVADRYFDVFALKVVAGAPWTPANEGDVPVPTVVNEDLAVELFESAEGAIGREVAQGNTRYRVVGVVAQDRHYGPDQEHGPAMYIPVRAVPFAETQVNMAVLADESAGLPARLREAVWSVEPNVAVPLVRSMESWRSLANAGRRFDSVLFATFGVVALLLAAGGLYGTLLYSVGRARREIGIRLALGAARREIVQDIVARGLALAVLGSLIGGFGAWFATKLLASRLFGVEPGDLGTLAGAVAVLLSTAVVAAWLPARRAAATDPLETLRQE